jgi:hypothetical protein
MSLNPGSVQTHVVGGPAGPVLLAASESGWAGLFRRDPGPPGGQEVANIVTVVHDPDATASTAGVGGLALPGLIGTARCHRSLLSDIPHEG